MVYLFHPHLRAESEGSSNRLDPSTRLTYIGLAQDEAYNEH